MVRTNGASPNFACLIIEYNKVKYVICMRKKIKTLRRSDEISVEEEDPDQRCVA